MPTLTVRNLDAVTVEALKRRAKEHGRSLEAEVRRILGSAAADPAPADLLALARRIAAMTPDGPGCESAALLAPEGER